MIPSVGEHRGDLVAGFGLPTGLITTVRWESTTATVFAALDDPSRGTSGNPSQVTGAMTVESVHVDAVVVTGCDARAAVRRASYFAPVARRIALVHQIRDLDDLRVRAAWLEVGVAQVTGDGLRILAHPGAAHGFDDAFKARFAETVVSSHLAVGRSAGRHPAALGAAGR